MKVCGSEGEAGEKKLSRQAASSRRWEGTGKHPVQMERQREESDEQANVGMQCEKLEQLLQKLQIRRVPFV